jgi:L-threonylcarbamoyladenylate synthase
MTLADIEAQFPQLVTLSDGAIAAIESEIGPIIPMVSGLPSTVVRWTGTGWEVLRPGAVVLAP